MPARVRGARSRAVLPAGHRRDPDERHGLFDVARRADHGARGRQRHLADHHGRHRREPAPRSRLHPGAWPHRRDLDGLHHHLSVDVGRRRRLHRLHGACAASHTRAISETPGRQQDVRRRRVPFAAEDQHLGRHPADLCLFAVAVAGDGRKFREQRVGFRLDRRDHRLSRAWPAALYGALYRPDRASSASSTPRSSSIRPRPPTICANMAGSFPGSGRGRTPPITSIMC